MDPFHSHSQRGSFSTSFPTSFPNRMGISHSEKFSRNDSNNNFMMNNSNNGANGRTVGLSRSHSVGERTYNDMDMYLPANSNGNWNEYASKYGGVEREMGGGEGSGNGVGDYHDNGGNFNLSRKQMSDDRNEHNILESPYRHNKNEHNPFLDSVNEHAHDPYEHSQSQSHTAHRLSVEIENETEPHTETESTYITADSTDMPTPIATISPRNVTEKNSEKTNNNGNNSNNSNKNKNVKKKSFVSR